MLKIACQVMAFALLPAVIPVLVVCSHAQAAGLILLEGGKYQMGSYADKNPNTPLVVTNAPFAIRAFEVRVDEFIQFLNAGGLLHFPETPQILFQDDRYLPVEGCRAQPVAWVTWHQACAYCAWKSAEVGVTVRLPYEREWEYAARGGIRGAPFPWGWGTPEGRAVYRSEGPLPGGAFTPNSFGLYDMSGNVAEWCLSDPGREDNCAVARGGSWAEKLEAVLRVDYPMRLPCAYRGADTGFRWIMEIGKTNLAGHVQSLD